MIDPGGTPLQPQARDRGVPIPPSARSASDDADERLGSIRSGLRSRIPDQRADAAGVFRRMADLLPIPRIVEIMVESAHDTGGPVRRHLAAVVKEVGDPLLPALRFLLTEPNPRVREGALYFLRQLGPKADPLVHETVALLYDTDDRVVWNAARCLEGMGPGAADAASTLAMLTQHHSARVRLAVGHAFRALQPHADVELCLQVTFGDGQWEGRLRTARLLNVMSGDTFDRLAPFAGDPDPLVRSEAYAGLERYGARGSGVLRERLGVERDPALRTELITVAGRVSDLRGAILPHLRDPDPRIRITALEALRHGTPPVGFRRMLVEFVADPDDSVATAAIETHMAHFPISRAVEHRIRSMLTFSNGEFGNALLDRLDGYGVTDQAILPALIWAVKRGELDPRRLADRFNRMKAEGYLVLESLLHNFDPAVRGHAARVVSHLDAASESAGSRPIVAVISLTRRLVDLLGDDDERVRMLSVVLFENVPVPRAIGMLDGAVRRADPLTLRYAFLALANLGQAAVPSLIRSLSSSESDVRHLAVDALGRIGPAAAAAIDPLERLAEDFDSELGITARAALERIRFGGDDR